MIRLTFFALILAFFSSVILSGCGGGAETKSNPDLGINSTEYNGPAARTADVLAFQTNMWTFLKEDNRCGQCHSDDQSPRFVDRSDVNKAYSAVIPYVNLIDPGSASIVTKVGGGHNCWLDSTEACAAVLEQMLINWANDSDIESGRVIELTAPDLKMPGESKSYPDDSGTFATTVWPIVNGTGNCQNCHSESATPLAIAPFFGSDDVDSAYEAAKSKMNIDDPARSRLVIRLEDEFHNCWSDCAANAITMRDAIDDFASPIPLTEIDQDLLTSMALNIADGIIASGGNRFENNQMALWEFKTQTAGIAYDTSGIDPAMDLSLIGSVSWLTGYGLDFLGGRAQASTSSSAKLKNFLQATGEYAIEAWVIPANVTQEDTSIISYSGSDASRNFALGQSLYNYEFYNRIDAVPPEPDGGPVLSTMDAGEILQATQQHVVANYSAITGRQIYVNGELIDVADPVEGSTTASTVWDDSFAFLIGNGVSGNRPWAGKVRFAALHSRTLSEEQILQNFDVGVGEKYFLLFSVAHHTGIADTYVVFQVSIFDPHSYLFEAPFFINLDPDWSPTSINLRGMRIAINGKESLSGQAFATINTTINDDYVPGAGQQLSRQGAIIPFDKGPDSDEFFLTFESIAGISNPFVEAPPVIPTPPADPTDPALELVVSDIGLRTFEEINASIAAMTGIPVTNPVVESVYQLYKQQLPSTESIDAFVPAHQMAIAQLALTSCSELVEQELDRSLPAVRGSTPAAQVFFTNFDFTANSDSAFTDRDLVIYPLLEAAMNVDIRSDPLNPANKLTSQPDQSDVHDLLGNAGPTPLNLGVPEYAPNVDEYDSLIRTMVTTTGSHSAARTQQIVKAVCAAAVGGAVMLVQ